MGDVSILVAVIGVLGVLGAQVIGWLVKRSELSNQRKLKEIEVEEARQQRLRDERITVYTDFAQLTYGYRSTDASSIMEALRAYAAIEVLGGSLDSRKAAELLYNRVVDLRSAASTADWHEEGGMTVTSDREFGQAKRRVTEAWRDFVSTAREELQGKK